MDQNDREEFGRILARCIRDASIQSCDRRLEAGVTTTIARRWHEAVQANDSSQLAKTLIADIVDDAIFWLLHAIDEGSLRMSFTTSAGRVIDLTTEGLGELAGWYLGEDGWRARFSQERCFEL